MTSTTPDGGRESCRLTEHRAHASTVTDTVACGARWRRTKQFVSGVPTRIGTRSTRSGRSWGASAATTSQSGRYRAGGERWPPRSAAGGRGWIQPEVQRSLSLSGAVWRLSRRRWRASVKGRRRQPLSFGHEDGTTPRRRRMGKTRGGAHIRPAENSSSVLRSTESATAVSSVFRRGDGRRRLHTASKGPEEPSAAKHKPPLEPGLAISIATGVGLIAREAQTIPGFGAVAGEAREGAPVLARADGAAREGVRGSGGEILFREAAARHEIGAVGGGRLALKLEEPVGQSGGPERTDGLAAREAARPKALAELID